MSYFNSNGIGYTSSRQEKGFGRGGLILRAQPGQSLSPQHLARIPAIFGESKHESRSEKYSYISTIELLSSMVQEGFCPVEIRQNGAKILEKRAFAKHLIRFQKQSGTLPIVGGDTFPEICLINSHDGTSSYQIYSGWYRQTCLNGLVACESVGPSIKVQHRGSVDDVIEASYRVIQDFDSQADAITEMTHLQLTRPEQELFAYTAASLRFDENHTVKPWQVLRTRRQADQGPDLWRTFNRIQENLTQGGIPVTTTNESGSTSSRRSRSVNSISDNIKLNQALWALAEEIRKLKSA